VRYKTQKIVKKAKEEINVKRKKHGKITSAARFRRSDQEK
jgi:hypothetical protein